MKLDIFKYFPPPHYLEMPSVGMDISDHSVRFMELLKEGKHMRIGRYGVETLPSGVVKNGKIANPSELVKILREIKSKHKLRFVRSSLPEVGGYLFEMELPKVKESEIRSSVEFRLEENVPLKPQEAVFDFDKIAPGTMKGPKKNMAAVAVYPRAEAEAYADVFNEAGLTLLSFEMEPQAIARSVVRKGDTGTYFIVDIGYSRAGLSVVSNGVAVFTTTVDVGGDKLNAAYKSVFPKLTGQELEELKNEKGVSALKGHAEAEANATRMLESLAKRCNRYVTYWNSRTDVQEGISKVLLCGGVANVAGLPEYLAGVLKLPVERADVWVNVFPIDEYIPEEVSFAESLSFAPVIGLALGKN